MNTLAYFEIQSSNPERDIKFYQTIFGWRFSQVEGLPIEYFQIETDGMFGGLLKRPVAIPPIHCGTNAFTCSIQVKNFDETAARIIELGGQIALDKFAVPNKCWQGYFIDPDHNTFGIFQLDENAK